MHTKRISLEIWITFMKSKYIFPFHITRIQRCMTGYWNLLFCKATSFHIYRILNKICIWLCFIKCFVWRKFSSRCDVFDDRFRVMSRIHDDTIKWKHFPRYWPFVRGIHQSPVNSPHKGQWPGALMFSWICVWINGWVTNREAGDLMRDRAHYDTFIMYNQNFPVTSQ